MGDRSGSGQTPSKVLHIRNLPYETTQEELEDLSRAFGRIVKTKLNVGANRNQAFIEFPDVNCAVNMVHHFMSSAEPAKVRGKTVYLQYSTRQEIVNATSNAENPSNVILATLENLQPDDVITIEHLWCIFAAFGTVHKIATFEKSAGFQALVQFEAPQQAKAAKEALDGRTLPRSVLPDARTPCQLRIAFSAHQDLNVRFQSHRGRDFMNPSLPWADVDPSVAAKGIQAPLNQSPEDGNVLLVQLDNYMYDITVDSIYEIFRHYGNVQKIAIFQKGNQWQALVQFPDSAGATAAKQVLEGHAMYEGGANVLRISYSVHHDLNVKNAGDKSRDFSQAVGVPPAAAYPAGPVGYDPAPMGYGHEPMPMAAGPPQRGGMGQYGDEAPVTGMDYVRAHQAAMDRVRAAMGGPPGPYGGPPGPGPMPGPPGGLRGMPGAGPPPGYMGGPPPGPGYGPPGGWQPNGRPPMGGPGGMPGGPPGPGGPLPYGGGPPPAYGAPPPY